MYKYNPVRDSSSSITTILPITHTNSNNNSFKKHDEINGVVRNKDPTSDGNLIITINDKDKLKISFIDIRLNSLYKDMLVIEQPELLMNDFNNDNYMINISGNIIISCVKPLILLKPISLELKGTFKLDFIEINNDTNKKDDDRRDDSVVVVKENRPFFLTRWDNVIDYPDGEVVDLCKKKYEDDLKKAKESYIKRKRKKNKISKLKPQSMYNIFGMRFEENGDVSSDESIPLTPINTHDNVFNTKKPTLKRIYQSAPNIHQMLPSGGTSEISRPTIRTNNSFRFLNPGDIGNVKIDISETPDDTTCLDVPHVDNKDNKIYMNPGNYEFPFRLKVNQRDMPETVEGLQAGSLTYMLTMKMHCENYGVVEHVKYLRILKTLKANNINIHTGFKFKHDLKVKQRKPHKEQGEKNDDSKMKAPSSMDAEEGPQSVDELVTQLQMHIETPSKAYPLGGRIPLKFQISPLIKNFKIDSIKISLKQKSILWDFNNEKYTIEKVVKNWFIDDFQGISGIEKVYLEEGNESRGIKNGPKDKKTNKLKILSKNNEKKHQETDQKKVEYRLCDSDIEFLYILPVPNNLKEITQNSLISENFYNGEKVTSNMIMDDLLDEEEFEKKYGYNEYKVLKLPRISNTHNLKVEIYVFKKNKRIPIEFNIPLILFCSPNVEIQMRKVLVDKFKRIHFRKGEVELFFRDLPGGNDLPKEETMTNDSTDGNTHEDTRNLMYSFIPRYFPQLQQVQPPPIYAEISKDEKVLSSMNETEGFENLKITEDINTNPPTYDNFRFDDRNFANRSDHQKIIKSERLTRDYYYGIYRDDPNTTGNRSKTQKFKEGVLQYEEISPEYKNCMNPLNE
ncbi:uncharacterized protein HGUI_03620 [Hanseniaspora guilliermondii]|uniref:Arrestin C-terminal-like domain-containing protein n=1 Tax=Hanseniaspora guilliermondii TaxID=56406 RepID=A0A1L0B8H4_9ASCO|nr:uncharacterized protein HGUI_03620 [Hanseniaspora guilliermondii]